MPRIVKGGLIQTSLAAKVDESIETIRDAQIERTLKYVDQAGREGVQILCMQEIFTGPYFCAEQNPRWYDSVERSPMVRPRSSCRSTRRSTAWSSSFLSMKKIPPASTTTPPRSSTPMAHTSASTARTTFLIRLLDSGKSITSGRETSAIRYSTRVYAKVGVYICYDRHFPEGARELGLAGAEIVMNPSATVAGLSEYLWKLEQPAHAVANGYFVGAINRVGFEAPWNIG
jgi:N-carbamoylputrescine amidase